jgi:hypothetical protein
VQCYIDIGQIMSNADLVFLFCLFCLHGAFGMRWDIMQFTKIPLNGYPYKSKEVVGFTSLSSLTIIQCAARCTGQFGNRSVKKTS